MEGKESNQTKSESIEVSQNHGILLGSALLYSHEEHYKQMDNFGKITCKLQPLNKHV